MEGRTPLMGAAYSNSSELIELFLSKGLELIQKDNKKRTILMFAAAGGAKQSAEFILSQDIINVEDKDYQGESALVYAVKAGSVGVSKFLL